MLKKSYFFSFDNFAKNSRVLQTNDEMRTTNFAQSSRVVQTNDEMRTSNFAQNSRIVQTNDEMRKYIYQCIPEPISCS